MNRSSLRRLAAALFVGVVLLLAAGRIAYIYYHFDTFSTTLPLPAVIGLEGAFWAAVLLAGGVLYALFAKRFKK